MRRFLEKRLGVYPTESASFIRAAGLFLSVFFFFAIFRNYVDASFLKRYGPERLPLMLCVSGVLAIGLFSLCRRLSRRFSDRAMLGVFFLLAALLQALFYVLAQRGLELVYPLLYQLLSLMDAFLLVYLWNLMQHTFDARQGKRLFRLLMAAQVLGSTLGSLACPPLTSLLGLDASLLVVAAANGALALVVALGGASQESPGPRVSEASRAGEGDAGFGPVEAAAACRRYPIFRFLCVCAVVPNLVLPILTYQFGTITAAAFANEQALLDFLGWFRAGLTGCVFLCITVFGRGYDAVSIRTIALAAPLNYGVAFGALAAFFSLPAAAYAQFSSIFLQRSALGPLTKQLFSLLPRNIAAWSQIFVRGTLTQSAGLFGALMLLALKQELSPRAMSYLALALTLVWIGETFRFRRRYHAGLRQVIAQDSLDFDQFADVASGQTETASPDGPSMEPEDYPEEMLARLAELDIPELDPDTALARLESPDAESRAEAAASFALSRDVRAVGRLTELLDDVETVRRAAVDALARYGPGILPILEQALLDAPSPRLQEGILEAMRLGRMGQADMTPFVCRRLQEAYEAVIAGHALEAAGQGEAVTLLRTALREKRREQLYIAFLALWVVQPDMRLAFESLGAGKSGATAEFLENVLEPALADRLVPLVDTLPEEEAVRRGRRVLPLMRGQSPERVLYALSAAGDPCLRLLTYCVIGECGAGPVFLAAASAGLASADADVRQAALYAWQRLNAKEASMPPVVMHMQTLGHYPIFSGLGLKELRAVASIAERTAFPAGAIIARAGETFAGIHLVTSGVVTARDAAGRTRTEFPAGGMFGILDMFLNLPADLDYLAHDAVEVYVIKSAVFLEIMKLHPLIGVNLCRYFSELAHDRDRRSCGIS
ncbi:HEAT repeat domain-containing protein [Solidesulfovibrio sp.]